MQKSSTLGIRLPPPLKAALRRAARKEADGVMSAVAVRALDEWLTERGFKRGKGRKDDGRD